MGNITSMGIDFAIPDDCIFQDYKLDNSDMTKLFPNRVQENIVTEGKKVAYVYLEWQLPAPQSLPPFYDIAAWKWLIPAFIGVVVTILVRDILIARLKKRGR